MTILQMNLTASVLIIAIAVIRALALYRFPKKCFLVLWGIVVLRLLMPVSIPLYLPENSPPEAMPTSPVVEYYEPVVRPLPNMPIEETPPPEPFAFPYEAVWLVGVCAAASFFLYSYVRCRKKFQRSVPCENDAVKQIMDGLPLRRRIQVRQSGHITAPLTYGVFRPVILLPEKIDMEHQNQLRLILTHEYIHIRRFDALTKLLLTVAVCVHWFNPLVWVMYELANRDIELSCDEEVLRRLGEMQKKQYAITLLHLEETRSHITAPLTSYFGKHATKERIFAMVNRKKYTRPMFILASAISLAVCVSASFTISVEPKDTPADKTGKSDEPAYLEFEYINNPEDLDGKELPAGEEGDSDFPVYIEDIALSQNDETAPKSETKVIFDYENAVRGDTALILARGGILLPDDDRESYTFSNGVTYKMFATKNSTPGHSFQMIEYEVGNKDVLSESELKRLDDLVNGEYPKNSRGESYGTSGLANYVGYNPDLIKARGTMGESGYVYAPEMDVSYNFPAEECPHEFTIPLYNSEHEQIGEFPMGCGGHLDTAGLTVEEAKQLAAADIDDTAPATATTDFNRAEGLINSAYPVTADGLTYGTLAQRDIIGTFPDLVSVTATNGESGWVKLEDFEPMYILRSRGASTGEINAYIDSKVGVNTRRTVPVYDLDMNVIGEFNCG